ncbi:MAG: aldo/keto reductase [Pirellulales bacterium]|nr:aldo/keto reductase [Pirellulales bacterium]
MSKATIQVSGTHSNSVLHMPSVGLGLWKVDPLSAGELVYEAISVGYRHLDSACDYGNEAEVGKGIERVLASNVCHREDLWITSKLWNTFHEPKYVRAAVERTLRDLQLDYLDSYLIHFPISLAYVAPETRYPPGWFFEPDAPNPSMQSIKVPVAETWGAMEELVDAGLVRTIGACNFGISLLRDLQAGARIQPSSLQVEMHPRLTQEKLLRFCNQENIAVTAFSPLGAPSYVPLGMAKETDSLLINQDILEIADVVQRTPAQVLLRWGVQRGTAVVPKTSQPKRLKENISLFDFSLSEEQMLIIDGLNKNHRFNDPGDFCEQAFNTFFPIYE